MGYIHNHFKLSVMYFSIYILIIKQQVCIKIVIYKGGQYMFPYISSYSFCFVIEIDPYQNVDYTEHPFANDFNTLKVTYLLKNTVTKQTLYITYIIL